MNEELNKLIEIAKQLVEQANKIKGMQDGLIYTNICKNCGKEIKVARKNHYFCNEQCKKEYTKKYRHNYYINMPEAQKEKINKESVNRQRELRAKRKELKNGKTNC